MSAEHQTRKHQIVVKVLDWMYDLLKRPCISCRSDRTAIFKFKLGLRVCLDC